MKSNALRIPLQPRPEQRARLQALRSRFAEACNALAPLVQESRCWNRVALHHMAYKKLREQFPDLGSQMVCNTIYSVSRISRIVYQHPDSPFSIAQRGDQPLPRVHFAPHAPVYFDRHTLSLKDGLVSLFTLDGRMRFQLNLTAAQERRFRQDKLREIVLVSAGEQLALHFVFADENAALPTPEAAAEWPEYVLITADEAQEPQPLAAWAAQAVQAAPMRAAHPKTPTRPAPRQARRPEPVPETLP
jgi:hypothetical protein